MKTYSASHPESCTGTYFSPTTSVPHYSYHHYWIICQSTFSEYAFDVRISDAHVKCRYASQCSDVAAFCRAYQYLRCMYFWLAVSSVDPLLSLQSKPECWRMQMFELLSSGIWLPPRWELRPQFSTNGIIRRTWVNYTEKFTLILQLFKQYIIYNYSYIS